MSNNLPPKFRPPIFAAAQACALVVLADSVPEGWSQHAHQNKGVSRLAHQNKRVRNPMPNDPPTKCGPPIFAAAQACARLCRAAAFPRFEAFAWLAFWRCSLRPWLCQRLFLTGFRRLVFGPQTASFLVRFWLLCVRRAAAFRCFAGFALGPCFGRCPSSRLALQLSSVAVPKLCQRLFLTGFRRPVFGPQTASFLVRFWAFCARRAAAFRCFGGFALGLVPGLS